MLQWFQRLMPRQELFFPLFGGYWGYQETPAWKVQRHFERWQAQLQADGEEVERRQLEQDS